MLAFINDTKPSKYMSLSTLAKALIAIAEAPKTRYRRLPYPVPKSHSEIKKTNKAGDVKIIKQTQFYASK